jgi:uracil-DNA glycosylase
MLNADNYNVKTWVEKFPDYKVDLKNPDVHESWKEILNQQFADERFKKIESNLTYGLTKTKGQIKVFPYPDLVFSAFKFTALGDIKVICIGQDPYFANEEYDDTEIPLAMGLSFSVPIGLSIPSSLNNIYNNMIEHKIIKKKPTHGNLESWAKQGCLMINTALTVQHKIANSHAKYWTWMTDSIIEYISANTENVMFVLWGAPALDKLKLIDTKKHGVTISSHPSGLSYASKLRTYDSFKNTNHFKIINDYLIKNNKTPIDWEIK